MAEPARSPRLLSRAALRAYLGGITATELGERIAQGRIPTPIWGLKPDDRAARWDQRAVDRALDAAGGIAATVEAAEAHLDRAFGFR
ncbi:hypothetical protein GXW78_00370 [Roseomonas terrae]|uniref:Transcriptional regulator n=1 Tax=Neoroseomonas terrae TaxID=424799 RepID=A0ABS5EAQ3_9PROT|nr:hypothetical protein [Neoroseomonas terrae]MBR0648100.1 hypothetical protein [Neoroseomonas terrae]